MQRCQRASGRSLVMSATRPRQASEIIRCMLLKLRSSSQALDNSAIKSGQLQLHHLDGASHGISTPRRTLATGKQCARPRISGKQGRRSSRVGERLGNTVPRPWRASCAGGGSRACFKPCASSRARPVQRARNAAHIASVRRLAAVPRLPGTTRGTLLQYKNSSV
jgi:hypothetical protein